MASKVVDKHIEQQQTQEINLARSSARMSHTLQGRPQVAQDKVLKFVTLEKPENKAVRDAVTRSVDLIRSMQILEGFKRSVETTVRSLKVDVSDLGFSVYNMMESVKLAIVDPARYVQKAAMKYIDTHIRTLTVDAAELAFIFQNLVKSMNLKIVDPDKDVEILKQAYVEAAQYSEANSSDAQISGEVEDKGFNSNVR